MHLPLTGWMQVDSTLNVTTLGVCNHVSTGLQQPVLHPMPLGPAFLLDSHMQFFYRSHAWLNAFTVKTQEVRFTWYCKKT